MKQNCIHSMLCGVDGASDERLHQCTTDSAGQWHVRVGAAGSAPWLYAGRKRHIEKTLQKTSGQFLTWSYIFWNFPVQAIAYTGFDSCNILCCSICARVKIDEISFQFEACCMNLFIMFGWTSWLWLHFEWPLQEWSSSLYSCICIVFYLTNMHFGYVKP